MLQRNRAFPNVVHVQSQREDGVFKLRPHEKMNQRASGVGQKRSCLPGSELVNQDDA